MKAVFVEQPCRNFQFFDLMPFTDPKNNREKIIFATWAGTGSMIIVDPDAGAGESIPLPGDNGGEHLLLLDPHTLLAGTSQTRGYLLRLDLKTRTWATPLRIESETYLWHLCLGSDGMVYGGTYPGGLLLRYDPAQQSLENLGRVSDNKDNQYTRHVFALPNHILVECGYAEAHLAVWDLRTRTARRFGKPGAPMYHAIREVNDRFFCAAAGKQLDFFDIHTLEPIARDLSAELKPVWNPPLPGTDRVLQLRDGRKFCVRGQEYYMAGILPAPTPLQKMPIAPPPTAINCLVSGPDGRLWGSCGIGQTIFSFDPATGRYWNSMTVCDIGGEVYGMAFVGKRLFMSAYCGGDHLVYDPDRPWDQLNNRNPVTLESVSPKGLIRPEGRSVIGPDGHFWTGWMARYGTYGGGLSRVDVNTLNMDCWTDPIPRQAIGSLAADRRYLYFTTSGMGNGLPTKQEPLHFVVWSPDGRIVWKHKFAADSRLPGDGLATAGGRVLLGMHKAVRIFNPESFVFERLIPLEDSPSGMLDLRDGTALVLAGNKACRIEPLSGKVEPLAELPGVSRALTRTPAGAIYFAVDSKLYRLE